MGSFYHCGGDSLELVMIVWHVCIPSTFRVSSALDGWFLIGRKEGREGGWEEGRKEGRLVLICRKERGRRERRKREGRKGGRWVRREGTTERREGGRGGKKGKRRTEEWRKKIERDQRLTTVLSLYSCALIWKPSLSLGSYQYLCSPFPLLQKDRNSFNFRKAI